MPDDKEGGDAPEESPSEPDDVRREHDFPELLGIAQCLNTPGKPDVAQELDALKENAVIERARIENWGTKEKYDLRNYWSWVLTVLLVGLVIFQGILVKRIGTGAWKFVGYETFLDAQAGVYFMQIVGMCYVVLKYLFNDPDKK
jgi:hypothetical protein